MVKDDKLYKTSEIVGMFGFSESWFRKLRQMHKGPKYQKIGRCVRYYKADVEAWLERTKSVVETKGTR